MSDGKETTVGDLEIQEGNHHSIRELRNTNDF